MGVASGCGQQEVGVASGSGWNLWVWLAGVECVYWVWLHVRRPIDFQILLIPYSSCICSFLPTFCSFLKCFLVNQLIINFS